MSRAAEIEAGTAARTRAYVQEAAEAARLLRDWYIVATKDRERVPVPSLSECMPGAQELLVMRAWKGSRLSPSPNLEKAVKFWKSLDRALERERIALSDQCTALIEENPGAGGAAACLSLYEPLFDRVRREREHMNDLLFMLGAAPPIDYVRRVERIITEIWQQAAARQGGRVPKSKGADDPLCKIIAAALEWIGHPESPENISAVLYNRRRKK